MTVLRWLILIEVCGISSWPLCFLLFRCFPDGGLGLSRLLGMLLLSYGAWLSARLGLFPYDSASLISLLVVYIAISAILYWRGRAEIVAFLHDRKKLLIFEQLFFITVFIAAVFIQAYKPDVTLAEKQPDLMFLQAILTSKAMPPEDLWFAGMPVNYYYLGYLLFGTISLLSAARAEIALNLAVATVVPLSCLGAFSVAFALTRRKGYALLAPLFLLCLGNFRAVAGMLRASRLTGWNWWYEAFAHGTREVIPGTIHEFPCFSFMLGDLHPHYMFIPFSFLFLALLAVFFMRADEIQSSFSPRGWALHGFFFSLVLGAAYMFHTWEYPSYIALSLLALFSLACRGRPLGRWARFAAWVLFLLFLSYILFLPFRRSFTPAAGLEIRFVDADKRSPLGAFLTVNGLACFMLASLLLVELVELARNASSGGTRMAVGGVILAGAAAMAVSAAAGAATIGLAAALSLWACYAIIGDGGSFGRLYVLVLAIFVAGIFLGCEIVYLKDFYGERLQRQNTVFKFYYQAWVVSSLVFAAGSMIVCRRLRGAARLAWTGALACLVAVSLVYPLGGIYHRCQKFRSGRGAPAPYLPTLDGMAFIRARRPGEYVALEWIREHLPERAVVLEATGEPFSYYGRVSAFTGRATVIGWANHESLWRDWTWKSVMGRVRDVERIYREEKKETVAPLIRKYGIDYIYVGPLERKRYGRSGTEAFGKRFPRVFSNGEVSIYSVTPR